MRWLLEEAKALEVGARAKLASVPTVARLAYPHHVREAENFCNRLTEIVAAIEDAEKETGYSFTIG